MRLAVTGRAGQVARALAERAGAAGAVVVPVGRPELDLLDPASVLPALAAAAPDAVVSAAAFTQVDRAEDEPELAYRVNAEGAGAVAAAAAALGVPVIHLSTDYVFDGTKETPWTEEDPTGPLSVYGASKLSGERAVASATADHAILRIAWVHAPFGSNFVRTMLRLAEGGSGVRVVADQVGAPTSALAIADGVLAVAGNLLASPGGAALRGVFHMPAGGKASWADVAEAVFAGSAVRGGPSVPVTRIATAEFPTRARRPAHSLLSGSKLAAAHGVRLPDWREQLDAVLDRLVGPRAGTTGGGR